MSKAVKFGGLILVLLVLLSAGMALSALSQKASLEKAKGDLEKQLAQSQDRETKLIAEKKKLDEDLKTAKASEVKLQSQFTSLNDQITVLSKERDDWRGRVDAVRKERDDLMAKLQERGTQPTTVISPPPQQPTVITQAQSAQPAQQEVVTEMAPPEAEQSEGYWASVLKEKASLTIKVRDLENEATAQAVSLEELKKKNSDAELELSALKNQKEELERKIKYNEDLASTLSVELAREKNDKRYISDRVDKIKEENLNLRSQVKELTAAKISLEKTIVRLTEDKDSINKRLAETESVIQNRIDEVMDIKSSLDQRLQTSSTQSKEVELPPIIVSAPASSSGRVSPKENAAAGFDGRVLSINEDNNFVVVNLGEDAGMHVGDTLNVYRGSKYIAGLEVIQVRKDICAADIKQKGAKIQIGDVVR